MLYTNGIEKRQDEDPLYWVGIYKRTFGTDDGKKVLLHMLMQSGMFYVPEDPDPNKELVRLGKRIGILETLDILSIKPEEVLAEQEKAGSYLDEHILDKDILGGEE